MTMKLQFDKTGAVDVVRVRETKLVYPILGDFFAQVSTLIEAGARKLLLDLSEVAYVDSASIGCLMDIYRLMSDRGGQMRLSGLQERVETMVSLTGLHNLVEVYREEKIALEGF
jgi:anti-anti-sigma factor